MQTKSEIQHILNAHGFRPNKKLGQNFLIDLNLMRLFIERADISEEDIVVEVGPGTGSMSEDIAERAGYFIAVEYDRGLAEIVKEKLCVFDNAEVIRGDVLQNQNTLNRELVGAVKKHLSGFNNFKLVANLPYDVSSALMVNLVLGEIRVDSMFVTVQREIAEKMAASPGDDLYGTLSVYVQAFGDVEIFHKLGTKVFWPAPKVDSAMVAFKRSEIEKVLDVDIFRQVVGMFFQHRRKTLSGCRKFAPATLKDADWLGIFNQLGIDSSCRPGDLSPADFVKISNTIIR